jgi:hypothetical protein
MPLSPRTLRPANNFTPRSISGLALWLDASDASTLFQDAAATTPATATSDPVGAWLDKSGNARHATQSTAGSRPTISATATNGKRALAFNGSSSTLAIANFNAESNLTGLTRYMVLSQPSAAGFLTGTGGSGGNFFQQVSFQGRFAAGSAYGAVGFPNYAFLTAGTRIIGSVYDGTAGSIAAGIRAFGDGASLPQEATSGSLPTTLASGSPTYFIGSNLNANNFFNGRTLEVLTYNRTLTSTERRRLERYLAAKYGITLAPQVSNADAQDWIDRVYANGGTVSASTAAAVNTFCDSIDSVSGLRACFYRLNLFCGGTSGTSAGLAACLVPLYRGQSLGGTQYGNTIDANNNFVVGDYAETGASGGLQGNGTNKRLDTGLPGNTFATSSRHLSAYEIQVATTDYSPSLKQFTSPSTHWSLGVWTALNDYVYAGYAGVGGQPVALRQAGHFFGQNTSSTAAQIYRNGSPITSFNTGTAASSADSTTVTVLGATGEFSEGRLGGYSIGLSMTNGQVAAYYTAMQAFQTALGRNV